jgi:hypothetical protein
MPSFHILASFLSSIIPFHTSFLHSFIQRPPPFYTHAHTYHCTLAGLTPTPAELKKHVNAVYGVVKQYHEPLVIPAY